MVPLHTYSGPILIGSLSGTDIILVPSETEIRTAVSDGFTEMGPVSTDGFVQEHTQYTIKMGSTTDPRMNESWFT